MKYLAIDYGTQRIGLALSYGRLAEPLQIIANNEGVFDQLKKIIEAEAVNQIVIGLSDRQMAEQTKQFAKMLSTHTALPIHFMDESFSSQAVHAKINSSMKMGKRAQHIDHFAAAHFLQEYLDTLPQS